MGFGFLARLQPLHPAAEGRQGGAAGQRICVFKGDAVIEAAIAAGITAAIQPGGSKRDDEVIAAADERGMTMLLTGRRHFKH